MWKFSSLFSSKSRNSRPEKIVVASGLNGLEATPTAGTLEATLQNDVVDVVKVGKNEYNIVLKSHITDPIDINYIAGWIEGYLHGKYNKKS